MARSILLEVTKIGGFSLLRRNSSSFVNWWKRSFPGKSMAAFGMLNMLHRSACAARSLFTHCHYHGTTYILSSQASASIYVSWSTGGHFKTTMCTSLDTAQPALIMVKWAFRFLITCILWQHKHQLSSEVMEPFYKKETKASVSAMHMGRYMNALQ